MSIEHPDTYRLSLDDALLQLSSHSHTVLAGGTDYYPALGDAEAPEHLIDITKVEELRGIRIKDEGISIGATTTWTDIIHADLPEAFAGLKDAAREVGSIQIQNAGTIAGNLCNASPAADGVPPLLALNADVELASMKGRRRVALSEFITGPRATTLAPGELLVAIHIPKVGDELRSGFYKLGSRRYLVISIVMASITLSANKHNELGDVRIAVGACSAVAKRLTALENALNGQLIDTNVESLIKPRHFEVLSPIDDVRAGASFRMSAAQEVVSRLFLSTIKKLPQSANLSEASSLPGTST